MKLLKYIYLFLFNLLYSKVNRLYRQPFCTGGQKGNHFIQVILYKGDISYYQVLCSYSFFELLLSLCMFDIPTTNQCYRTNIEQPKLLSIKAYTRLFDK